jgi:hypothetical protein
MLVAVRVRPVRATERTEGQSECCTVEPGGLVTIAKCGGADASLASQRSAVNHYAFDQVLPPDATQREVYESTAKGMIKQVIDGFDATVFAYGSTGAGKTHTMMGVDASGLDEASSFEEKEEQMGIIPRALIDVFAECNARQQDDTGASNDSWTVTLSYLEVYNEQVYDLLTADAVDGGGKCLPVREDREGTVHTPGLTQVPVGGAQAALAELARGNRIRKTEATVANQVSSRSHAIMVVTVRHTYTRADGEAVDLRGKLSLIDLAGSEKASSSQGARLKEGANINKSLLALANVINALAAPAPPGAGTSASRRASDVGTGSEAGGANAQGDKRRRVSQPLDFAGNGAGGAAGGAAAGDSASAAAAETVRVNFRDSKLTHLLKNSLLGQHAFSQAAVAAAAATAAAEGTSVPRLIARVVMIANVNPCGRSFEESHNTLKYANRAKNITVDDSCRRQIVQQRSASASERAANLAAENTRLREELRRALALQPGDSADDEAERGVKRERAADTWTARLETEKHDAETRASRLQAEKREAEARATKLQGLTQDAEDKARTLEADRGDTHARATRLYGEKAEAEQSLKRTREEKEEAEQCVKRLRTEKGAVEKQAQQLQADKEQALAREQQLASENSGLQQQVQVLQQQLQQALQRGGGGGAGREATQAERMAQAGLSGGGAELEEAHAAAYAAAAAACAATAAAADASLAAHAGEGILALVVDRPRTQAERMAAAGLMEYAEEPHVRTQAERMAAAGLDEDGGALDEEGADADTEEAAEEAKLAAEIAAAEAELAQIEEAEAAAAAADAAKAAAAAQAAKARARASGIVQPRRSSRSAAPGAAPAAAVSRLRKSTVGRSSAGARRLNTPKKVMKNMAKPLRDSTNSPTPALARF